MPRIGQVNCCLMGDCLEVMKDISDKSIDMVLTDLPYGITARNKWDSVIPIKPLFEELERICKGAIVMTAVNPFASELVFLNKEIFKYDWIWKKERGTGFLNAKKQPLRITENILVFYVRTTCYNPQMNKLDKPYKHVLPKFETDNYNGFKSSSDVKRQYKLYTHTYPTNLLEFPRDDNRKGNHPTQKPIKLFEYLIKTYSNEGDIILDCCAGSGTTAIACMNTDRNYICIEKDEKYFKIMQDRITESINVFAGVIQ